MKNICPKVSYKLRLRPYSNSISNRSTNKPEYVAANQKRIDMDHPLDYQPSLDNGRTTNSMGTAVDLIKESISRRKASKRSKSELQITTGYSAHNPQSESWALLSMGNRRPTLRSNSSSCSSKIPNEEFLSWDDAEDGGVSGQLTGLCGNSDATPSRSVSDSAGKEIIRGYDGNVVKAITREHSYRMETEWLPCPATHASLGFDNTDHLILTQFDEKTKDGIRTLLEKGWERGIQKEGPCNDTERYFFKLKKRPFSSGNTYVVTRMTRNIIAYLASESWLVQPVASLLSPYDTLNFRKCSNPLPKCYWLALTYGYSGRWDARDQLCVLGGADELIDTIRLTLQEMDLISRLGKEHNDKEKNWHQFRIKGSFFRAGGWARKKIMILRIMERLEERGWTIYAGYHRVYHASSDNEKKVGTWLCVKSREWTPTNPVKMSWAN
ncbi:hypothetical protein NHQ30_004156 [Ciborinia camelliae]|nr:hypothetical protein NHQ30_004156 [Ciborinia camelliae]